MWIAKTTFTERHFPYSDFRTKLSRFEDLAAELLNDTLVNSLILIILRSMSHHIRCALQKTTVPDIDEIVFKPKKSRRAVERPSSSEPTFNPENSERPMERSSSSEPTFNPENSERIMERPSIPKSTFNPEASRRAMERSSSSKSTESFTTAREFPDQDRGSAFVYLHNVLV